jgi:outer membrane protein assembly factor BamB
LKWSYTTAYYLDSSPAVANGMVYVGSDDYNVYVLDAKTGAKLWSYTTGYEARSSPAVANGVVYVGSLDNNV